MSTYINVTVGKAGLSDKAKQQTNANRQAKLEADARNKAEVEGKRQRDVNRALQGIGPDGKPLFGIPLQTAARKDEPAAFRVKNGRGDFGWITGISYAPTGDAFTPESRITSETPIVFKTKGNFGVIKVGTRNACADGTQLDAYFANRTAELASFAKAGGVVWIQNEWLYPEAEGGGGCGISAAQFNPYIQQAFQTTMSFNDNGDTAYGYDQVEAPSYGIADKNALVYTASGMTAPPLFYTDRVATISGGTPMYASTALAAQEGNNGVVVAFEKIGKGFLVMSADADGTGSNPIGVYAGEPYTFIDALRTLK
jgi:hypothetical protein